MPAYLRTPASVSSPFVQAVQTAGLVRNSDDGVWTLGSAAASTTPTTAYAFADRLSVCVKTYTSAEMDQFLGGFAALMDTPSLLMEMLSPVRQHIHPSSIATSESTMGTLQQSTLIRMLLNIHTLQPFISQLLLEKLAEFSVQDMDLDGRNLPKLLIRQLSWLDLIVKPTELADKIIELIPVLSGVIQAELISSLPEIIVDSENQRVSLYLIELMAQTPELTHTILDTLTSLSMDDCSLVALRDACIDKLDSADLDTLPVIICFLLNMIALESAPMVIQQIRSHLNMNLIAQDLKKEALDIEQKRSKGKKEHRSPQALILESIRTSFQTRPFLLDAWIRVILDADSSNLFRSFDLLVIITIYSLSISHRKRAQLLIKKKALSGDLLPSIVKRTISGHGSSIPSYFLSILGLGDYMMSTGLECCHDLCIELFISLFQTSDVSGRQHVIGSLATHIGTGLISFFSRISLSVLLELSSTEPQNVIPFSIFIKSILDHLDKLSVSNVRRFFEVLSNLAVVSDSESFDVDSSKLLAVTESSILSNLHIVIRKYLGSTNRIFKHIGVLGSAVLIQKLAEKESMTAHTLSQAQRIFETTVVSCRRSMSCLSIVFDELAFLVSQKKLHLDFVFWLRELVNDGFLDIFVLSDDEMRLTSDRVNEFALDNPRFAVPFDKWMELENCEGGINIYPLALRLARDYPYDADNAQCTRGLMDLSHEKCVIIVLCSQFKLWQACETATTNMSDSLVNAMLVSGLAMFQIKDIAEINVEFDMTARYALCTALFQALNLFREIINCFGSVSEKSTARLCLSRLRQILQMEKFLHTLLASLTGWIPPALLEEAVDSGSCSTASSEIVYVSASTLAIMEHSTKSLRPLMRELDMEVFSLLSHLDDTADGGMDFNELEFLLIDLMNKVEFHFVQKDRAGFRKTFHIRSDMELISRMSSRKVFSKLVLILPGICKALENTGKEIRSRIADEDSALGVVDQPMLNCFELLMRFFSTLLKWPSLKDPVLWDDQMSFLEVLSSRALIQENSATRATQDQLVGGAFDYISRFEKCLLTGEAAAGLLRVLAALHSIAPLSEITERKLRYLSNVFINQYWKDKLSMKPETLLYLIQQHISMATDPLSVAEDYFIRAFKAIADRDEDVLVDFPLLTRTTFLPFFKAAFSGLCQQVSLFSGKAHQKEGESEVIISRFSICFSAAISLVRQFEQPQLISVILKKSRVFLLAFIKRALPVLTREFKKCKEDIIHILRSVQTGTRILQSVCSETKVSKDNSLAASVPPLRKVLELFLYEVKKLLADNNSLQAFSIGNLKHRDISGGLISSQIPTLVESEDDTGEEKENDSIEENEEDILEAELAAEHSKLKASKKKLKIKSVKNTDTTHPPELDPGSKALSTGGQEKQQVNNGGDTAVTVVLPKKRRLSKLPTNNPIALPPVETEGSLEGGPSTDNASNARQLSEDVVTDEISDTNAHSSQKKPTKKQRMLSIAVPRKQVAQSRTLYPPHPHGRRIADNGIVGSEGEDDNAEVDLFGEPGVVPLDSSVEASSPIAAAGEHYAGQDAIACTNTVATAPQPLRRIGLARRKLMTAQPATTTDPLFISGAPSNRSGSFQSETHAFSDPCAHPSQSQTKLGTISEPLQPRTRRLGLGRRSDVQHMNGQPFVLSQSLPQQLLSQSVSEGRDQDEFGDGTIVTAAAASFPSDDSEQNDKCDVADLTRSEAGFDRDPGVGKVGKKAKRQDTATVSRTVRGSKRRAMIVESESEKSEGEESDDTDLDGFIVNSDSGEEESAATPSLSDDSDDDMDEDSDI
ncbi:hypothetical protein BASA50_010598 [Batrachochytrium salamandrivorans]|uniref:Fanconi anemia group D2 protein n=1 Tax=Batrachochytrium salamandrivorans TaxID=1357716 RepID=A0ABQ8EY18_9FUNG|nr:hypothetical protein BASA50_010598 [Batrachochytrium salamandrivorans]